MSPTAIAVAPNGGRRTKQDHPSLPMTAAELAETAAACLEQGASMIHVHVRDADGGHALDAGLYREAIAAIRAGTGDRLVIQITSEALGLYDARQQGELVRDLRPEAVSLALRELAPDEAHEAALADLMAWMAANSVLPQIILYSAEEARRLRDLLSRGVLGVSEVPVLFVLGRYSPGQKSDPADLAGFLAPDMPKFSHWSVCAFGPREAACVVAGALAGGHGRVGFENNLQLPDGAPAESNAALVAATARPLRDLGLSLASADDLRAAMSAAFRR